MDASITLLRDFEIYEEIFQRQMKDAKTSISIATANVKDVHVKGQRRFISVIDFFEKLCGGGIEIRLLHGGIPSQPFLENLKGSALLEKKKFTMRRCMRVHFKAVIIDARRVFLGSANLTGAGMGAKSEARRNFELGILTSNEKLVDKICETFDAIWEGKMCAECKRMNICPVPLEEPELT